jgi:CRISPR-associated protein Cmr1
MTGQWQDLTLRTVTPAFLGRFDTTDPGRAEAPFPVPSLRGVLAYWLRALAGAHVGNDTSLLHDVESAVFGSARTDHAGGPSPIQIRGRRVLLTAYSPDPARTGLRYLLGPGLTDAKKPPRYLRPGQVELRVRNDGSPASADLFLAALWALRTFGGIGARSRRGFGTLAVGDIPSLAPRRFDPAWLARDRAGDLEDILQCVAAAIGDLRITIPPGTEPGTPAYPCFAPDRYRVSADDEDQLPGTKDNWADALDQAGELLRGFRHGGNRRIPGPQPRVGDHSQTYTDVAQPFLNGGSPRKPAIVAALGLPIPYTDHQGRQGAQRKATIDVSIGGVPARRASPLWLRVLHDGSSWRLRSLAFHDEWLPPPPAAQLRIISQARSASVTRPTDGQIRAELDRWFDG